MADVKITVDAGVCRFKTIITVQMDEEMNLVYKLVSECPKVRELGKNMPPVPLFDAIATPFSENAVYVESGKWLAHAACPVACAMIKAAEVCGELALKKDVSFKIE